MTSPDRSQHLLSWLPEWINFPYGQWPGWLVAYVSAWFAQKRWVCRAFDNTLTLGCLVLVGRLCSVLASRLSRLFISFGRGYLFLYHGVQLHFQFLFEQLAPSSTTPRTTASLCVPFPIELSRGKFLCRSRGMLCSNGRLLLHEAILQYVHVRAKAGLAYSSCSILECRATTETIYNGPNRILLVQKVKVITLILCVSDNALTNDVVENNFPGSSLVLISSSSSRRFWLSVQSENKSHTLFNISTGG